MQIHFDPYSPEQLMQIAQERRHKRLVKDALDDEQLQQIAIGSHGNAYVAIETIRRAGLLAEQDHAAKPTSDHIQMALVNRARATAHSPTSLS